MRFPNELHDRLDENYNNPKYDEIELLLSRARFSQVLLGQSLANLNKRFLLNITSGKTPENIRYAETGIPFIGATSVKDERVNLEVAPRITRKVHETTLKGSQIKNNDVLITIAGFYIGRCAPYVVDGECNANQAIAILRPNPNNLVSKFLAKYYNSYVAQLHFEKLKHVSGQPNINLEEILQIPVILPPRATQESILSKIEPIENEAIRKELLVERKLSEIDSLIMDELGFTIPELGKHDYYSILPMEVGERLDFSYNAPRYRELDRLSKSCKYPFRNLSPPLVQCSNETTNPLERPEDIFSYVDIGNIDTRWGRIGAELMLGKDATSSRVRRVMRKDQVLVSTTRPTRKAITVVPEALDGQVCSTGFAVLNCLDDIDSRYLFHILRSELMRYQLERFASGSSYPEINKEKDLPLLKVPVPPKPIQEALVERIERVQSEAESLSADASIEWNRARSTFDEALIA